MNNPRPDLPCSRVVEMVTDYLEGELTPEDHAALEQHLILCDPCVHYVEQTRLTVRALKNLAREGVNPSTRAALLDAFRKQKGGDKP